MSKTAEQLKEIEIILEDHDQSITELHIQLDAILQLFERIDANISILLERTNPL